ncbi:MAG: hypothetical protein MJZ20_12330 [Bacteroidaceae bacterium]|nr:hypothetical protein [Bacteroidaceae bacterium]
MAHPDYLFVNGNLFIKGMMVKVKPWEMAYSRIGISKWAWDDLTAKELPITSFDPPFCCMKIGGWWIDPRDVIPCEQPDITQYDIDLIKEDIIYE